MVKKGKREGSGRGASRRNGRTRSNPPPPDAREDAGQVPPHATSAEMGGLPPDPSPRAVLREATADDANGARQPQAAPGTIDETPRALRDLLVVLVVVLVAASATYAAPGLTRLVPISHERLARGFIETPVIRHFFAPTERGDTSAAPPSGGQAPRATTLGADVQAGLAPVAPHIGARARIDAAEYAGLDHHVVDEGDRGLAPFYEALRATAEGRPRAITRVAHYGDSSIAIDTLTSTVRRNLQQRFGDSGHGFVLVSKGYMAYGHVGLRTSASDSWQVQEVTRASREDGRYGFGGVVLRGSGGARARFASDPDFVVGKSVSRFELWHATGPRFGSVELRLDGGEPTVVDARAEVAGDAVHEVVTTDGDHELSLRALGPVELYGVVLERDVPGVVYDSLGLVGARASRLLNFDEEHVQAQLARRHTNLLVLGFGGNEASDSIDPPRYEADFERVVRRMRGERRDLGCLVLAPLDQAGNVEGRGLRTFRGLPAIVEAQRRVAARLGCAFFDVFHAMGGEGSMVRWYRVTPRLASGDFRHATPAGYEVIGNLVYKALLEGFARYLEAHPTAPR